MFFSVLSEETWLGNTDWATDCSYTNVVL